MVASIDLEPQRIDIQFSVNVLWSSGDPDAYWTSAGVSRPVDRYGSPVRAMYSRLARAYESEPAAANHSGGLPGDRFAF